MACNVFGTPVTDTTLQELPQYIGKPIKCIDRAKVALDMKNAEGKDVNARCHVENLKKRWGVGTSMLVLIYNATGNTVRFAHHIDWWGHIGPAPYPKVIANGQWGAFLHVKTTGTATGSTVAVVYRGVHKYGSSCDWLLAWSNPWNRSSWNNTVLTDVCSVDYHLKGNNLDCIKRRLYGCGLSHEDTWGECSSIITTGCFSSPIVEAILTQT